MRNVHPIDPVAVRRGIRDLWSFWGRQVLNFRSGALGEPPGYPLGYRTPAPGISGVARAGCLVGTRRWTPWSP